ncbi:MAG: hypothetical protein J6386_23515 [Candidatus Synoicihabitans palmerolidicus]|nr:hypothetical protein [Candidatus Synoicihabitans palmerolidicus]
MSLVTTDHVADIAPSFSFVETVQGVATGDAGFAARAGVEFDLEGVLFAGTGFGERDEG